MEIIELTVAMEKAYEAFVRSFDESLIYYSLRYRDFVTELLGCRPSYWIAREGDQLAGVLPLMAKDGPYGRVWNSLPYYGSNGGVLARTPSACDGLHETYRAIATAPGVASSTIIANPFLPHDPSRILHDVTDPRMGHLSSIAFSDDIPQQLLAALPGARRRAIRRALAAGTSVRVDNERMDFLRKWHPELLAELGGLAKTPRFFDLLERHFRPGEDYRIYVAEQGGEIIAGLLVIYYHKTVEYYMPVTLREHRTSQPMALILHQAMAEAAEAGYTRWNWGGTWLSQQGVYEFKRRWGATDYPYNYYTKMNDPDLLRLTPAEVLRAYEGFFVLPFRLLAGGAGGDAR